MRWALAHCNQTCQIGERPLGDCTALDMKDDMLMAFLSEQSTKMTFIHSSACSAL